MGLAKYLLEGGDLVGKWNKALWPNVCSVEGVPIYCAPWLRVRQQN
jgi:hypothetical protein